jgi:hypothetical protein
MHLSPPVSKAIEVFRQSEAPTTRGPRFKDVALAFEQEMRQPGVPQSAILEAFGPPDIQQPSLYVYFFDHHEAGRSRDEWYFHFKDGKLSDSGYNHRGVNDFSSAASSSPQPG